jgi:MFS family permease
VGKGADLAKATSFYELSTFYPNLPKYYGILSGAGFSLSYAFFGLLWGQASDKYNRKWIVALACIGWSLTSIGTGSINSLAVLALMRFILGATQAACEPISFSLIADYFPPNKSATAASILTAAPYLGGGLSSLNVLLVAAFGWKAAFNIIGVLGLGIGALAFLLIKEPMRQ